jgi:hypothetical protein
LILKANIKKKRQSPKPLTGVRVALPLLKENRAASLVKYRLAALFFVPVKIVRAGIGRNG